MKEIRVKMTGYSGSRAYAAQGDQSGTGYQDFCTGDWNLAIHYAQVTGSIAEISEHWTSTRDFNTLTKGFCSGIDKI
ncbi:hypothetical protein V6N13_055818 [Hibiscus sabdariffa]